MSGGFVMMVGFSERGRGKWLFFSCFPVIVLISILSIASTSALSASGGYSIAGDVSLSDYVAEGYTYPAFVPERADVFDYGDVQAGAAGSGGAVAISYGAYSTSHFFSLNRTFIVFRDDDVAPFWSFDTLFNVTELFRRKDAAHVMALIPDPYGREIGSDPILAAYIKSIKDDPSIEFALHGNDHSTDEFAGLSYDEASFRVEEGLDMVEDLTGMRPVTFVPPYHAYNDNTIRALSKNNMSIISSGPDDVSRGIAFSKAGNISHIPATADFYNWGMSRDNTLDEIKNACQKSLDTYGGCVILFHHWQFADSSGKIIPSKIKMLSDVIDWAKGKESSGESVIVTFRDVVFGRPVPLPSIVILSPSEKVYNGTVLDLNVSASEVLVNMSYRLDIGDDVFLCSYCDRGNSSMNISRLSEGNHSLSVFGTDDSLRMIEASLVFGVDSCIPQWSCGGYGDCIKDDMRYCNVSRDILGCYEKTKQSSDIFSGDVKILGNMSCDYCTPNWKEANMTCQANDRFLGRYVDSNNCYALTNLSSDNARPPDNSYPCDFCTPSWVCSAYGLCTLNGTRACISFADTNGCYARTGLPSDNSGKPLNDTVACVPRAPVVTVNEPRVDVDYRSQYVALNVSVDEASNCSYALNGGGRAVLFAGGYGGAKMVEGRLGTNLLNISCTSDSGYTNDSISLRFNVSVASYAGSVNLNSRTAVVIDAPAVNTSLAVLADRTLRNVMINITASLFNPTNVSFGAAEIGRYVRIEGDGTLSSGMRYAMVKVFYGGGAAGKGVDEESLALYWFNDTAQGWVRVAFGMGWVYGTGVNTTDGYVWANVSHFSVYGIGGKKADGGSCSRNDECVSANCVHGTCRAGSTYCGDSFCDAGESCSSCSADCGSCRSSGSSSGSGRRSAAPPKVVAPVVNKSSVAAPLNMSSANGTAALRAASADGGDAFRQKFANMTGGLNESSKINAKPQRILRNTTLANHSDATPTGAYLGAYSGLVYGGAIVIILMVLYILIKMRR